MGGPGSGGWNSRRHKTCADCGRLFERWRTGAPDGPLTARPLTLQNRCPECHEKFRRRTKGGWRTRDQTCEGCGVVFRKAGPRRFCGDACGTAWCKATFTLDATERGERRRLRARAQNARRRAKGWRRRDGRWRQVCAQAGWMCHICKGPIDPALSFPDRMAGSVDHVVPLSCGGSDDDGNLAAAHYSCNSRRGNGDRWQRSFAAKLGALNRRIEQAAALRDAAYVEMTR